MQELMDVPDRVAWMRQGRHFNLGITGRGFADERLPEFFEDEPVWIIAPVLEFCDFLQIIGLTGLLTLLPHDFEPGFREYRVMEGPLSYSFRVWHPGKTKRLQAAQASYGHA